MYIEINLGNYILVNFKKLDNFLLVNNFIIFMVICMDFFL